jgi:RNA recognition motif-containing protein
MSQPSPQPRGQPSPQARHAPPARQLSDPSLAGAADGLASSPFHFNTSDSLSPHRSSLASSFAQQQQLSPSAAGSGGAPLAGSYAGGRSPHDTHASLRRSSLSPAPAGQRQQQQSGGASALSPSQQAFGSSVGAHGHSPHSTNSSFDSAPRSHSPAGGGAAHSPRSYTPSSLSAGYAASSGAQAGGAQSGPPPASPLGTFGSRGAATAGGGSNSDHSRHSSGYGSSLGIGGGGGTAATTTASYGAGSAMGASALGSHSYTAQQQGFGGSSAPPPADDSVEAAIAAATKGGQPLTPAAISAAAAAIAASEQQRRPSLRQSLSDHSQYSNGGAAAYGNEYGEVIGVSSAGSGPLSASDPRTQLFISNLPYRVRWQDLKDLFRKAGTVLRADVALTPDNRSRGHGTVLLASEEDAHRAVDMFRGFSWQGRILEVRIDRSGTILLPSPPAEGVPGAQSYMSASSPNMSAPNSASAALPPSFKPNMATAPPPGSGVLPSPSSLHLSGSSSPHDFAATQSTTQQNLAHIAALHAQQAQQAQQQLYQQQQQQHQQAQQQVQHQHQQQHQPQPTHAPSLYAPQGGSNPYGSSALHPTGVSPALYPFMGNANGRSASLSSASGASSGPGAWSSSGGGYGRNSFSGAANQAPGYHSQQHLHHTAHAPPPNLNAGAGRPSAYLGPPLPPGSTTLPPPNSYYGRVLFVGNLPFHCQWQDLKDLFRAAGNIQRADVALSPEGRSRGFGTVLFASAEDAQNAVRIYHGCV